MIIKGRSPSQFHFAAVQVDSGGVEIQQTSATLTIRMVSQGMKCLAGQSGQVAPEGRAIGVFQMAAGQAVDQIDALVTPQIAGGDKVAWGAVVVAFVEVSQSIRVTLAFPGVIVAALIIDTRRPSGRDGPGTGGGRYTQGAIVLCRGR